MSNTVTLPIFDFEIPLNVVILGLAQRAHVRPDRDRPDARVSHVAGAQLRRRRDGRAPGAADPDPRDQQGLAVLAGARPRPARRGDDRRAHRGARHPPALARPAPDDARRHDRPGPGAVRLQPADPPRRRPHRQGVPDAVRLAPHGRHARARPGPAADPHRRPAVRPRPSRSSCAAARSGAPAGRPQRTRRRPDSPASRRARVSFGSG